MLPFTLYCNCHCKYYEKKEISIGKKVIQSIHATRHASTVFHPPSQMLLDSISSLHFASKRMRMFLSLCHLMLMLVHMLHENQALISSDLK